jgi:CO dehydrogenase/acetyl-CoA synthase alpha subunit
MAVLHKLLTLDESSLLAMAANPNFLNEFGFLKGLQQLKKTRTGCGRCNQGASKRVQLVNAAKQSIVSMGVEKKRRLKTLLSAQQIRLRVSAGGKVTEYTF